MAMHPASRQTGKEAQGVDRLANAVPPGGWRTLAQPRLRPMPPHRQRRWQRGLLRFLVKRQGVQATHLFATLLHAPRLFVGWLLFASRLMPYGQLPRRLTELAILRAAWLSRCAYEWHQHVRIGQRCGLDAADIQRVMAGPEASGWTDKEAALLGAVDDIVALGVVSDACWTVLANAFPDGQQVEIVMLASHYRMLASVIDSLGIQVEQGR